MKRFLETSVLLLWADGTWGCLPLATGSAFSQALGLHQILPPNPLISRRKGDHKSFLKQNSRTIDLFYKDQLHQDWVRILVCAHSQVVYDTEILELPCMINNIGLAKYTLVFQ